MRRLGRAEALKSPSHGVPQYTPKGSESPSQVQCSVRLPTHASARSFNSAANEEETELSCRCSSSRSMVCSYQAASSCAASAALSRASHLLRERYTTFNVFSRCSSTSMHLVYKKTAAHQWCFEPVIVKRALARNSLSIGREPIDEFC